MLVFYLDAVPGAGMAPLQARGFCVAVSRRRRGRWHQEGAGSGAGPGAERPQLARGDDTSAPSPLALLSKGFVPAKAAQESLCFSPLPGLSFSS